MLAAAFFVFGSPVFKDLIIRGLEEGSINSDFPGTIEQVADAIQIMFISMAITFIVLGIFSSANIFFSFKGRNNDKKGFFIANIVLGVLSGNDINVVAAVFGLIKGNTIED